MSKSSLGWLIRAGVTGAYRRGGLDLSGGQKITIAQSKLSAKKLAALEADPRVTIKEVKIEQSKPVAKKPAAKKKVATKKTVAKKTTSETPPSPDGTGGTSQTT